MSVVLVYVRSVHWQVKVMELGEVVENNTGAQQQSQASQEWAWAASDDVPTKRKRGEAFRYALVADETACSLAKLMNAGYVDHVQVGWCLQLSNWRYDTSTGTIIIYDSTTVSYLYFLPYLHRHKCGWGGVEVTPPPQPTFPRKCFGGAPPPNRPTPTPIRGVGGNPPPTIFEKVQNFRASRSVYSHFTPKLLYKVINMAIFW